MLADNKNYFNIFLSDYQNNRIIRFLRWVKKNHLSFSVSLIWSIILHVTIFSIYIVSSWGGVSENDNEKNIQALTKAFNEVQAQLPMESKFGLSRDISTAKNMMNEFPKFRFMGDRISEKDRLSLYQNMIDIFIRDKSNFERSETDLKVEQSNLEEFLLKKENWKLDSGGKAYLTQSASGNSDIKVNVLSKDTVVRLEKSKKSTPLKENFLLIQGEQVKVNLASGIKYAPAGYFFRECPYEELIARGADLFYIIKGFPYIGGVNSFETKTKDLDNNFSRANEKIPWRGQEDIFRVFIMSPSTSLFRGLPFPKSKGERRPDATKNFENIDEILDGLMIYPEDVQFDRYKKDYLEKYDLNNSDLVRMTDKFISNNLSSVFIHLGDISCAFDYLEEIYFNESLDTRVYSFWQSNSESKVGIQFLFYLAFHYDFERRALQYLFTAYTSAKKYLNERFTQSEIYQKKSKCYVICKVYENLIRKLDRRGYKTLVDVLARYVEEEENIYRKILKMGGEYRNIGLFELGSLYWEGKQYDLAFNSWKQIDQEFRSIKSLKEIRISMAQYSNIDELINRIDSILKYYANRGSEDLLIRLVKFGHWNKRTLGSGTGN